MRLPSVTMLMGNCNLAIGVLGWVGPGMVAMPLGIEAPAVPPVLAR